MIKLLRNPAKPLKNLWLLIALGLATMFLILNTAVKSGTLILNGNFETGDFAGWKLDLCCKYSGEIVSSPTRLGNYAAKFTLNRNDPYVETGKRAELKRYGVGNMGSEYWYGFSIYIPNDWVKDTAPEMVTQWHNRPDLWFGEGWLYPPLFLLISGDKWKIGNMWDSRIVTQKNNIAGKDDLWSGAYKKGEWTDWVFRIKWSHKSDGLIEAWKDGVQIINKRGPNTYNDLLGPFFKVGIYKYPWKSGTPTSIVDKRVLYFDEVRVGNASASYKDLAPSS